MADVKYCTRLHLRVLKYSKNFKWEGKTPPLRPLPQTGDQAPKKKEKSWLQQCKMAMNVSDKKATVIKNHGKYSLSS